MACAIRDLYLVHFWILTQPNVTVSQQSLQNSHNKANHATNKQMQQWLHDQCTNPHPQTPLFDSIIFRNTQPWKIKMGRRDAEKQFKSAIKQQPMIGTFLMLGKVNFQSSLSFFFLNIDQITFSKVYLRLDQPLAALEVRCEKGRKYVSFLDTIFVFFFYENF